MSLRLNIILLLTLVALVTSLTLHKVATAHRHEAEHAASMRLKEAAIGINRAIDADLRQRYADVQAFAQNRAAYQPANWRKPGESNPLVSALNRYITHYDSYTLSMLVAPDGRVLAVNSRDSNGNELDTKPLYEQGFSDALWFSDAKDGRFQEGNDLSGTTVIGPYNDKLLASLLGDDGLTLAFSAQVTNDAGQMVGIWVNFVPFAAIERPIAAAYELLKADGLPRTAITLLDTKGTVLVDYDPSVQVGHKRNYSVIGKMNMVEAGVASAKKALDEKGSGVLTVNEPRTKPLLVDAYSYSQGIGNYPGVGWTVLVRANGEELFAPSTALERALFQSSVMLVVAVLLSAAIFIPRLRRPAAAEAPAATPAENATPDSPATTQPAPAPEGKLSPLARKLAPDMQAVARELADASTSLRHEMERLTSAAHENCRRSAQITSSLSHAAMAANQMDLAAAEITEAAETIDRHLDAPARIAGNAGVQVDALAESLDALVAASGQMEEIVPFLTNLANQINLLALNATIEAARAGDTGTGFAVIADELKSLAAQAASAMHGIGQQLESAQDISHGTVTSVRNAMEMVTEIGANAAQVSDAVALQRNAASKVVRNIANTENGLRDLTGIVGSVEEGADETAASVKQLQATAVALHRHIAILNEKVERWVAVMNKARA